MSHDVSYLSLFFIFHCHICQQLALHPHSPSHMLAHTLSSKGLDVKSHKRCIIHVVLQM